VVPDDSRLSSLSTDSYELLKHWILEHDPRSHGPPTSAVFHRTHITRLGQRFEVSSSSSTNSQILYRQGTSRVLQRRPETSHSWNAGVLNQIFSHTRTRENGRQLTQTFAVLTPYETLSKTLAERKDRYKDFPVLANRLFYEQLSNTQLIIPLDQIVCHFAYTPVDLGGEFTLMHAHPLDKVCMTVILCHTPSSHNSMK
jgi:hypothetical protein